MRHNGGRALGAIRRARDWLFEGSGRPGALQAAWLPYVLAGTILVAYPVWQLLAQPRFIFGGDMWAEMATNYYPNAHSSSILDRLFATDAGYIPLPQRILAGLVAVVGVPAGATPYVYTAIALVGSAVLVGAICLPTFRAVIPSDWLRFGLALLILGAVDFQSRTFINFTYMVVPLAIFMLARAIVTPAPVPLWFWVLPPLMMSKPAVLVVVPAIIVAMVVGGRRIRWIGGVAMVFAVAQVVRLLVSSHQGGSLLEQSDVSGVGRLVNGLRYTAGALSRYIGGPLLPIPHLGLLLGGVVALLAMVAVVLLRGRAGALILIAFSTLLLGMLLNTETFSATFSSDLHMVDGLYLDRRFSVPIWSVLIILTASLSQLLDSPLRPFVRLREGAWRRVATVAAVVVLFGWAAGTGWIGAIGSSNRPLGEPTVGISTWEQQQQAIEKNADVCVLVDPIGWVAGPHCGPGAVSPMLYTGPYRRVDSAEVQALPQARPVRGAALLVRVQGSARLQLASSDGTVVLSAEVTGDGEPEMVQLQPESAVDFTTGQQLHLTSSAPLDVWWGGDEPAVIWLVRP